MFLVNLFLRARGIWVRFQQDPGAKSSEKDRLRERERSEWQLVDESKGKGMKDTRDDGENGVSHGAERPQMQRIVAGYFPFTPIAFS